MSLYSDGTPYTTSPKMESTFISALDRTNNIIRHVNIDANGNLKVSAASANYADDIPLNFGSSSNANIEYDTDITGANHLVIRTDDGGLQIKRKADAAVDTNPTFSDGSQARLVLWNAGATARSEIYTSTTNLLIRSNTDMWLLPASVSGGGRVLYIGSGANTCTVHISGSASSNNTLNFGSTTGAAGSILGNTSSGLTFTPPTSGSRFLNFAGAIKFAKRNVADIADTTLATDNIIAYTTLTASRVVTLIAAASTGGTTTAPYFLTIKDESGNCAGGVTITVDGNGAETIDGAATLVLNTAYSSVTLYCNGTAWFRVQG